MKAYWAVDLEGLYTLGTVVIDYRGYRVTAQSIIPGILEREQEQSVVYGSIDFGKTVVASEKYVELVCACHLIDTVFEKLRNVIFLLMSVSVITVFYGLFETLSKFITILSQVSFFIFSSCRKQQNN